MGISKWYHIIALILLIANINGCMIGLEQEESKNNEYQELRNKKESNTFTDSSGNTNNYGNNLDLFIHIKIFS